MKPVEPLWTIGMLQAKIVICGSKAIQMLGIGPFLDHNYRAQVKPLHGIVLRAMAAENYQCWWLDPHSHGVSDLYTQTLRISKGFWMV